MVSLTQKEREVLLLIFKDFSSFYNANNISKILDISHVGAQKIFKRLQSEGLVIGRRIGKSIIYKPDLGNDYTHQLITFLLADEANRFKRWKEEFRELFKKNRIVMLFGSTLKNYAQADDIDIVVVLNDVKEVNKIIKEKEFLLPKPLHAIKMTHQDLLKNIQKKNTSMLDIVKNAVILYGQREYVEVLEHVTGF